MNFLFSSCHRKPVLEGTITTFEKTPRRKTRPAHQDSTPQAVSRIDDLTEEWRSRLQANDLVMHRTRFIDRPRVACLQVRLEMWLGYISGHSSANQRVCVCVWPILSIQRSHNLILSQIGFGITFHRRCFFNKMYQYIIWGDINQYVSIYIYMMASI